MFGQSFLLLLLLLTLACSIKYEPKDELTQFPLPKAAALEAIQLLDEPFSSDDDGDDGEASLPKGWHNCGTHEDLFHIHAFSMTPDPPKRSRQLAVRVAGELSETLQGGLLNYTVMYGVIPIVQDSLELCEALRMEPKIPQCPLKGGNWDVTHEVEMPREVPFGRYTVKAQAWSPQGKRIFCVEGTTVIGIMTNKEDDDVLPLGKDSAIAEEDAQLFNDDGIWNQQVEFPELKDD